MYSLSVASHRSVRASKPEMFSSTTIMAAPLRVAVCTGLTLAAIYKLVSYRAHKQSRAGGPSTPAEQARQGPHAASPKRAGADSSFKPRATSRSIGSSDSCSYIASNHSSSLDLSSSSVSSVDDAPEQSSFSSYSISNSTSSSDSLQPEAQPSHAQRLAPLSIGPETATADCADLNGQLIRLAGPVEAALSKTAMSQLGLQLVCQLGAGGFSSAQLAVAFPGTAEAVIVVAKETLCRSDAVFRMAKSEHRCLADCNSSPYVVRQYSSASMVVESGKLCWRSLQQYAPFGDLAAVLKASPGALPEGVCQFLFAQALVGCMHIHAAGIVHCDIKPQNMLMGMGMRLLYADFNMAQRLHAETGQLVTTVLGGTPGYIAPEVLSHLNGTWHQGLGSMLGRMAVNVARALMGGRYCGKPQQPSSSTSALTPAIDAYALGVVLYNMLNAGHGFGSDLNGRCPSRRQLAGVPALAADLIQKLMARNPAKRMTVAGAMAHPWLSHMDWDCLKAGVLPQVPAELLHIAREHMII